MLRDSRTTSAWVFIILVCASGPGHGAGPRRGRQDCTSLFKGRTIRLESLYYKSYWLHAGLDWPGMDFLRFAHRNDIFDHSRKMSWQLHDCQDNHMSPIHSFSTLSIFNINAVVAAVASAAENNHVCLQNRGVNNYWLRTTNPVTGMLLLTGNALGLLGNNIAMGYLSDVDRDATEDHRFKIFCDSCEHHDRCQVYTKAGKALYPRGRNVVDVCSACGNANWFDWDIVLLTPRERWETVDNSVCNRTPEDQRIKFTDQRKVGVSRKVAETHGIGTEISASMASNPLTWSYGGKITHKSEWKKEEVRMSEHTTSITIGDIRTPPNKKAVLKQLMGYYGDFQSHFTMKSRALEVRIEDCSN